MRTKHSIWLERLDKLCWDVYGLGIHGLPRYDWTAAYQAGANVTQAIEGFCRVYPTYNRLYGRKL